MEITCPECNFTRHVPEDKIPPRAEMATCPKCKHKFRFRELEPEEVPGGEDFELSETGTEPGPAEPEGDVFSSLKGPGGLGREEPGGFYGHEAEPGPEPGFDDEFAPGPGRGAGPGRRGDEGLPPFERLEEFGFFPGLFATIRRSMTRPGAFFAAMPTDRGKGKPLAFALLLFIFSAVCQFAWSMAGLVPIFDQAAVGQDAPMAGITMGTFFLILALSVLLFTGGLFLSAGITHLVLAMFGQAKGGFEGTFRAFAYGSSPMLLTAIPLIGHIMAWIGNIVVTVAGLKNVHDSAYPVVIMAYLAPFVVFLAMVFLLVASLGVQTV